MTSIIQTKNLTKKYGDLTAVDQVSLDVQEGEIFSLLGPNGAGKTTMISILTTIAAIDEGSAVVAGCDVKSRPGDVRNSIGLLPQEITLDGELRGIENVLFAAKLHHVSDRVARSRARELLRLVELESSADKRVDTYSGGMKRRLQLIAALIHEPKILFLDEPTVGLDIQTRVNIWDYIKRLNKQSKLTIFMTTHYLEEADYLSNKVAIMDQGSIKVSGSPRELKDSLQGDVLTLELSDGAKDFTDFLGNLGTVRDVTRSKSGSEYRLKLPSVETALPEIITEISSRGFKIRATSFSKPTLDQVFLEVTGRSMRDSQDSNEHSRKH